MNDKQGNRKNGYKTLNHENLSIQSNLENMNFCIIQNWQNSPESKNEGGGDYNHQQQSFVTQNVKLKLHF